MLELLFKSSSLYSRFIVCSNMKKMAGQENYYSITVNWSEDLDRHSIIGHPHIILGLNSLYEILNDL